MIKGFNFQEYITAKKGHVFQCSDFDIHIHPRTFIFDTHKLHVLEMLLPNFYHRSILW